MKPVEFDPHRLDVRAFARQTGRLQGRWPVASFGRLLDLLAAPPADEAVDWLAEGFEHGLPGGARQTWLRLQASVGLTLRCQRCLDVLSQRLIVDRRFLFVRDEAEAARLDDELEDDVLVVTRELDLRQLLEDELLLEMPLVPRHRSCAAPVARDSDGEPTPDRPFGALAALRRGRRP